MSEVPKRSATPWIAGVVVMLLGLYIGAYFLMVERIGPHGPFYPRLHRVHRWANWIFTPIHAVDRRVRPRVWADVIIDTKSLDWPPSP